ncbi:alpha/beta hydrolase [Desulfovibrio inopinatus]|uniref:alpha/beta hydrolase n=1 Tax=Desulfovibrio inopinatus TaxID=102109 RepID=UPI0004274175|nr:alpha/beta fold hydrolase [Desulfovibrio inopinatus]
MYIGSILSVAGGTAFLVYLGIMGYMYVCQRSMVFPGADVDVVARSWITRTPEARTWTVTMHDGVVLEGALLDRGNNSPVLLYWSGNAEDALSFFPEAARHIPEISLASLNYRGFGESQGEPTQDALKQDALAVFDALIKAVGNRPVIVFGRSLGTAIAAHVAARRPVHQIIMLTPFDSITAVGQSQYPWLPVRFLLRHGFDVLPDARNVHASTLFLLAGDDTITPLPRAYALQAVWSAPSSLVVLEHAGHNDVIDHAGYWPAIVEFLSGSP